MMNKFTIININKGDSDLPNRVPHIQDLLDKYKPAIMSINELNYDIKDSNTPHSFHGYNFEFDNLAKTDQRARTGFLIHQGLQYKRRKYLEEKGILTVWLQISQQGKNKSFLVQSVYRQLQRLGRPGSHTPVKQYQRWERIIDKWQQAIQENRELITVGDLNLNQLAWDLHPTQMTSREQSQNKMVLLLKEKILSQGFAVLNNLFTRNVGSRTEKESCLDYLITNRQEVVANHRSIYPIFSDHSLLEMSRNSDHTYDNSKLMKIIPHHKWHQGIMLGYF